MNFSLAMLHVVPVLFQKRVSQACIIATVVFVFACQNFRFVWEDLDFECIHFGVFSVECVAFLRRMCGLIDKISGLLFAVKYYRVEFLHLSYCECLDHLCTSFL